MGAERNTMRLIIGGSRGIQGTEADLAIREALVEFNIIPTEIISGGAHGVDEAARRYADEVGIDFAEFPANWKKHGKSAGYKRNQKMAWYAKQAGVYLKYHGRALTHEYAPGLLAIWDGKSAGTKHMIDIAEREGIPNWVFLRRDKY